MRKNFLKEFFISLHVKIFKGCFNIIPLLILFWMLFTNVIGANPVDPPLDGNPFSVGTLLAFFVEILLILLLLRPIGFHLRRLGVTLLLCNLPIWFIFRVLIHAYVGAELELFFKQLPVEEYFFSSHTEMLSFIVGAELVVVLIEGSIIFGLAKLPVFRKSPNLPLSFRRSLLVSFIGNTLSAIIPGIIDALMGISSIQRIRDF
jgi:hypothetical protein